MWGPSLAGVPGLNVPARLPYTTYSHARFDSYLAKEEELRDVAEVKHQQLIRHGLVSRASLVPILALPEMTEVEEKRRRKAAAAQIAKYEYESSGDEEEPTGRLARLKTALKRHELPPPPPPPPPPEDAESDTEGTSNSLKRKADETFSASDEEEQHEPKRSKLGSEEDALHNYMLPPTLNFQEASRNPSHPDFGLSFSSALELALDKEKMEVMQGGTREHWAVEGDAAEAAVEDAAEPAAEDAAEKPVKNNAKATIGEAAMDTSSSKAKQASQKSSSSSEQRPKLMLKLTKKSATSTTSASSLRTTSQQPSRAPFLPKAGRPTPITRLDVQPLYDQDSFETAVAMRELGLDFGDLRMVGWFNHQMQADDRSWPIRNQRSLLRVSRMTWEEHTAGGAVLTCLTWRRVRCFGVWRFVFGKVLVYADCQCQQSSLRLRAISFYCALLFGADSLLARIVVPRAYPFGVRPRFRAGAHHCSSRISFRNASSFQSCTFSKYPE
jgi:hypothetical protein